MTGQTLFEKVWNRNVVADERDDRPAILHVGLHLIHEVTSPQAFDVLKARGLKVRRPDLTLATADHSTPTLAPSTDGKHQFTDDKTQKQVERLMANCVEHGVDLLGLDHPQRGIVHMIGPELGRTQPGLVVVCGDSHTSTHGAFGALAFGIGTTEVGHVLATQTLFQRKPKTMRITFTGEIGPGVTAKDIALKMIETIGASGATGFVLEYAGAPIRKLSMEARMTLCNLSIEAGARAGMIAPDDTTFEWLKRSEAGRAAIDRYEDEWRALVTDGDATFDHEVEIDVSALEPMATYGTAPDAATGVTTSVPTPPTDEVASALDYMGIAPQREMADIEVNRVFVGSCTNGRLSDIRDVATILRGRHIASSVQMLVVPGSESVRRDAEAEGLHEIIIAAGAEWRLPGCSMCIAMNGDRGEPGEVVASTSNRNFRGRQGEGVRTILVSPLTAAASALTGKITDPRPYLSEEAA